MKKLLVLIGFLSLGWAVNAQQELLLSQQYFSRINKNPAGIGNVEDVDLFLLGHYQYAGVEDAPKTLLFNAQTFISQINSGVGITFSHDNLGITRSFTNAKLVYSYGLRINDEMLVSLGLSMGILGTSFDAAEYIFEDDTEWGDLEKEVGDDLDKHVRFDMDFGAEFTFRENLLAGFSITHLTNGESLTLRTGRHFYWYARYLFNINDKWDIAPMLTYMHHEKTNVLELNVTAFYNRFIWGGLTWHPDMSDGFGTNPLAITLGAEYKRFRLGYTFDYAFGNVSRLAGTSHELMFSYSIERKKTSTAASQEDFFE
ncbi:MAG: PorP/SprF family type IX secretion system membrane protein [Paludibacteraceae bacterium]|jgi:type IX secretion system PorP/SprF family membrane protein|nr:PorP/SprF family type IX secretion system membrane protein [Paludibacteraceae bacterium]